MTWFRIAACLLALVPSASAFARSPAAKQAFVRTSAASSTFRTAPPLSLAMSAASDRYSLPDQPARFAQAQKENDERFLDISTVYDPAFLKGKRVAVTGANRGIGLALATELTDAGAHVVAIVRSSSDELEALEPAEIVKGIDVTNDDQCAGIADQIKGGPIDIVSHYYLLVDTCRLDYCFDLPLASQYLTLTHNIILKHVAAH